MFSRSNFTLNASDLQPTRAMPHVPASLLLDWKVNLLHSRCGMGMYCNLVLKVPSGHRVPNDLFCILNFSRLVLQALHSEYDPLVVKGSLILRQCGKS